ncbi:hypothetical protein GUITHDRAFT_158234 [Guillardia theta CCMP2712]|uniref:CTLH domain-containing protein n=1 Tax=Guillardia theta (strain CCMP2712) TaxID=905079 RepID=L1IYH3_GUITC|nr:hypothetical protein GUITHDRAFT_158234 [Guillardia theta CCMP2712]EKX41271.1 hypothetical protein GUITHDRAFT_158234 [Guillardia theta CCMP2712]|eukprot:XP_005828251.1 hypothetical protein GUITHDRAFT_158234 [Guillardia theta CCMP2712]
MEAWQEKLDAVNISKEDLNCLVLNFLVIEGYKDTAEKFAKESCTKADVDLNSIGDRMQIRAAVHHGNIADAIERVNDLNPEILETNVGLLFKLQQQRLIEMIREGKVQEALGFVQEELLTLCENNSVCLSMYNVGKLKMVVKDLLFELETTLSLLAFENLSKQQLPSELKQLLEPSFRHKTATSLNAAILASQDQDKESKLPLLLKMLVWVQEQ